MSKGGGGSTSTAGLEQAAAASTALQKEIYEQNRADIQPWYKMGTGAVSKLSDLLGISGGSVQSRDDIYNTLMPQYTQDVTSNAGGSEMWNRDGQTFDAMNALRASENGAHGWRGAYDALESSGGLNDYLGNQGWTSMGGGETTSSNIDYDALNAAVDAQYANQGDVPAGFGSLLEKFDQDKMKDSDGYQFRQEQGNKALERAMAAQGITLGGGGYGSINPQAAQAMTDYSQGLASQEYNNEYNRYVGDQLNTFNMLMGASGSGQQATGQMSQGGQAYATNTGNIQTGLAQAQFQNQQANNSKPSMFGSMLGAGIQLAGLF